MIFNFESTNINYIVLNKEKKGEPIVFLHGWGGSTKSFEFLASKLPQIRPLILLDFPPFGESSALSTAWSVQTYARMVISLLSFLNFDKFSVVAHSFGGRVAIHLASTQSAKISKLILTGSAGIKRRSVKVFAKILRYKFLKLLVKLKLCKSTLLKNFGSDDYKNLDIVMKQTFVNIVNFDQRKEIKNITCPTLLFWGKSDAQTPFYFTKYFKKHIKDCAVIKVKGSHFAYLENAEQFLAVMRQFFRQT